MFHRSLVAILLVLTGAGVLHRWVYGSRASTASTIRPLPAALSDIPLQLGPFQYRQDFELQPDVLRVAKVDSFLHREYMEDGANLPILLYVGYWGQPNTGLGHGPEVCFPSAGWTAEGSPQERSIWFRSASNVETEAKIAVHHFVRTEPEGVRRISVGFTAVVGGRFQPSSRGSFLHSPPAGADGSFVAHVQVGSAAGENAWAGADERVGAFMENVLQPLSATLFGHGSGQSSIVGK
ncbi:MAG: exosortase-associated EpsI family protein [Planctomycetota bacterium]